MSPADFDASVDYAVRAGIEQAEREYKQGTIDQSCRTIKSIAKEAYRQGRDDALAGLADLRDELLDAIDGGEECRGRDSQISRWIRACDAVISRGKR